MPRPKSALTEGGKVVGVRMAQALEKEFRLLGAGPWLRKLLAESIRKRWKESK